MWKEVPRRSVGNPRAAAFCRYSGAASASRAPAGSRPAPTPDSVPLSACVVARVLPDPGVRWACRRGGGALPGARGGLPRSALICVRRPRPRAWSSGGGARPARSATGRCVGRSDRCARSLPPAGLWFGEAGCSRGYLVTPFSSHRRCEAVNFKPGASTGASRLAQTVGNAFPLSSWGKNCKNVTVRSSRATPPWTRRIPSGLGAVSAWMGEEEIEK